MLTPKPMPKDPVQAKIVFSICYGFTREHFRLMDMLECDDFCGHTDYIKSKMRDIEQHLEKYFPLTLRINCRSMVADGRNDFDRYNRGNWVAFQTNKKYGRNIESWKAAKRVRDLLDGATIPF